MIKTDNRIKLLDQKRPLTAVVKYGSEEKTFRKKFKIMTHKKNVVYQISC